MATNNNGSLLDSAGEIAIDAVWGNMPPQPNDARTTRLDLTLGDHINLESGWGGYPQFTANSAGSDVAGSTDYVQVSDVRGFTTALAEDALRDNGLTVTTATAATNTLAAITRINATSATVAVVFATSANTNYPLGTKVQIFAGTPAGANPVNVPTALVGTWTVTDASVSGQITIAGSGFTVADTTGINATGTLAGLAGTIKTQSIAGGAATTAVGAAVTITPWATAS
jgi:hypothetical protein